MRREFSDIVRERALFLANYRCSVCSYRNKLQFHHVGNRGDNSLFNCQVLCEQCHVAEEQRRKKREVSA